MNVSPDEISSEYVSMSQDEFAKKKKWLFKENVRLEELRRKLESDSALIEEERKIIDIQKGMLESQKRKSDLLKAQLNNQKQLFDMQWQILERETRQLAIDKERFERDKLVYRDKVYREARRKAGLVVNDDVSLFFKGIDDFVSLKKRYKALLKIYHPDNMNGDKELLQQISDEYERLVKMY